MQGNPSEGPVEHRPLVGEAQRVSKTFGETRAGLVVHYHCLAPPDTDVASVHAAVAVSYTHLTLPTICSV